MSLKLIKTKIIATKKTGKVTRAMEAVSAVKMRKSQERAFGARPYARAAVRILAHIARSNEAALAPYVVAPRSAERVLLVMVTSDKGLAGAVNSAVLKRADELRATYAACDAICVGRKAAEYAERNGVQILHREINLSDGVSLADVQHITDAIMLAYARGVYTSVRVLYQNFVSTFEQHPVVRRVLPLAAEELDAMVRDIVPKTGVYADRPEEIDTVGASQYIVEPSAEVVIPVLVSQLVHVAIYHALLESKASEHSARMVAMKNATDKSRDLVKALTVTFNKARQAAITAEVSEITAGVEAMK